MVDNGRNTIDFIVSGQSISENIREFFSSATITDNAKEQSDAFTLSLSDPHGKLNEPESWKKITIVVNGISLGEFEINEISGDIHGLTYDISGTAITTQNGLKAQRSRSFSNKSIGEILSTVASEHGYKPVVDSSIGGTVIEQVNQMAESDLNLLTRLASNHGAIFKATSDMLVIAPEGSKTNVRGDNLPTMQISEPNRTSGTFAKKMRDKTGTVKAAWLDESTNSNKYESAGSGTPLVELPKVYSSQQEAAKMASSKLKELNSMECELSLLMPLSVGYAAGCHAVISNHGSAVNGEWLIESFEHVISADGYDSTTVKMKKPE